ncbi:pentatricopeptide repeat protein-like protein [Boeremia exigua]|uniref:pentatricopeptide repeat protein-like protein n=1 Tax=Boeremia exigua TaxID=749465 RepID=UPI001E8CD5A0|nr:pentatricopeptide repeat protein-like protein [Boeremia exigua]KAH6616297.1 pentatricopeptide repeat protein-like protein [Boeremia exigua]
MLNCRACLWQCVQPFDRPASLQRIRRNVNPLLRQSQQRLQSTDIHHKTGTRPYYRVKVEKLSQSRDEPWKNSAAAENQQKWARSAVRQAPGRVADRQETPNLMNLGRKPPHMSDTEWNRRKRELRFLQDPLDLAQFVRAELEKDKVDEMKQLVQMASHSMACVVSWNHIIDHYLAKSQVAPAIKVYNEMKKRAQFPDSYTYTILLRGLSINAHVSGVLEKALSIYHSMYAPNSRVEPSIIHTNAALRVCARALDMDALWGIAAKIPETGAGAANATTYNTIINAIRQSMLLKVPTDESAEEAAIRKDRSIMEARRLWEDIAGKWKNADVVIDEELVCSMARLLLMGARPRDWDDVLSLVEQTMDIPRLVPRLGTMERVAAGFPRLRTPDVPDDFAFDDDHLAPGQPAIRGDEFLPFTGNVRHLVFVKPGNNTLSVLQEACQKIAAPKAAHQYWDMLADSASYAIKPDLNNLNQQLRNMRLNRASGAAAELLQKDIIGGGFRPGPGTFRIAMSTCVRDKNNHNSLKHASQILHHMNKAFEDADPKTVGMYADLALRFPLATGQDLIDALTSLHPIVKNLRLQLGVGAAGRGKDGATPAKGQWRQDILDAIRKVYAVYDRLLLSNLIAEEQKHDFKKERARLSAFIHREAGKDSERERRKLDDKEPKLEEYDQHSYLSADNESGETDTEPPQKSNDEGRIWRSHQSKDNRGSWRTRDAKPEGQRRPWGNRSESGRYDSSEQHYRRSR